MTAAAPTVALVTLGCPKNLVDSEYMAAQLGRSGLILTNDPAGAEAIIVNTCAFIRDAREEAYEAISQAAAARREGRCRALVVAGCLARGFAGEIRDRFPEVDAVTVPEEAGDIAGLVRRLLEPGAEVGRLDLSRDAHDRDWLPRGPMPRLLGTPPHYAYLKVAEGCSHRCSFCLIPSLRGPYRSRPPEDLLAEARQLEESGVRELILVAQDTTAYGRDLRPAGGGQRATLTGLVRLLLAETSLSWLRVLYGYPATLPGDFIDLLAAESPDRGGSGRLCRYLDLPMQHAGDRVLKAMGRPETYEFLVRMVDDLRRRVPRIVLRSTFIIGFPGETEADFEILLEFLARVRLDHAGFFAFSPEAGTRAAEFGRQVPEEVKRERLQRAAAVQRSIALEKRKRLVGRTLRVLVDRVERTRAGRRRTGGLRVTARTEGDAPEVDGRVLVRWPASRAKPEPGDFVEVEAIGASPYDLRARPVDSSGPAAPGGPGPG